MDRTLFLLSDVSFGDRLEIQPDTDKEKLVGSIISNRIVNIAYDRMDFSGLNRDLVKGLKVIYDANILKSLIFIKNLKYISKSLECSDFKYAFLKGAYLATKLYSLGQRTSNDIDILVSKDDIPKLQHVLIKNGFVQGTYNNDIKAIVPATRREIVFSRINTGQTIPFVKVVEDNPIEIDINFSVDYKPDNNGLVEELLDKRVLVNCNDFNFYTLSCEDFLIHLCCHLYKEATTFNWVNMQRDLSLYKFSDINIFLAKHNSQAFFERLAERISQLCVQREVCYTLINSSIIYTELGRNPFVEHIINIFSEHDMSFMKQIVDPKEKRIYRYDMEFVDWFFCSDRAKNLIRI